MGQVTLEIEFYNFNLLLCTLISLIAEEVGINEEGVHKFLN